jgi:hypothetical protein
MSAHQRGLLILLALNLTACSGSITTPPLEPAPQQVEPTLVAVEFPPTWTPTVLPTQPKATNPPQATEEDTGDHNLSSTVANLSLATPVPASMSTSTWQRVEGATASFMLPSSFEVLDMGSEFGMLMAALMTGLMEGMVEIASDIGEELGADPITPTPFDTSEVEAAFSIDFVLAMQDDQKTSAFLFSEPLEEPSTLERQIQATLDEQDNPIEILSIDRVIDSTHETARMLLLATDTETGDRGNVLIYIILLTDRVYQLGYTTDVDQFVEMSSIFETSASTFRVNTQ